LIIKIITFWQKGKNEKWASLIGIICKEKSQKLVMKININHPFGNAYSLKFGCYSIPSIGNQF